MRYKLGICLQVKSQKFESTNANVTHKHTNTRMLFIIIIIIDKLNECVVLFIVAVAWQPANYYSRTTQRTQCCSHTFAMDFTDLNDDNQLINSTNI